MHMSYEFIGFEAIEIIIRFGAMDNYLAYEVAGLGSWVIILPVSS